jgi:DNA-binding transcriptional LysR family regulator
MRIVDDYGCSMTLSLSAVRAFVAVARTGSFQEAARLLGVRQPTISSSVGRLEAHAGGSLLRRNRDGVTLTGLGERILPTAASMIAAADDLESQLAGAPGGLTLGFMGEAAGSRTHVVMMSAKRIGGDGLRLRKYDFEDPACGLRTGETDVALVWPPISDDGLSFLELARDRRAVAMPVTDPLAAAERLRPEQLVNRHWILPESPDPVYNAFRHPDHIGAGAVSGIRLSASIEETLELVTSGAGIALVSVGTEQHYARSGVVVVPLEGDLWCTAALAWRRSETRPKVMALVDHLRNADHKH